MIQFLLKKPFSKRVLLSNSLMKDLLVDLPKLDKCEKLNLLVIDHDKKFKKLIFQNWLSGTYQLKKNELSKLSKNPSIQKLKRILINSHNIGAKNLDLKSSCIFNPKNCKYIFRLKNHNYLYHKYHIDSGFRIKALIILDDSIDEKEQFSYIEKFPDNKFYYYFKIHFFGRIIVFLHKLIYFLSFKIIKLSGQPPELPIKYQNPEIYKKYNDLKFGEMITFHNLYPHSSHTGFSRHKTVMLQLVFDIT